MSTPQTLTQALPPHQYFDHRQRYLPSPQDRYLPPPRPSSNVSGFHGSIPTRPPSNVQLHQLPPPSRTHSGMSNRYSQSQARGGAEYGYTNGYTPQISAPDPSRTSAASGRYQQPLHHEEKKHESRAPAIPSPQMPPSQDTAEGPSSSADRKRRRGKEGPDWEQFYSKGVPKEVILIHEGDTPPPPKAPQQAPPPPTTGASGTQHVVKRRRVSGDGAEAPIYSATNTPYSHSNGTSTDSLQATTAPTSLGSNASSSSRLEGAQAGQKRKRTTRTSEIERKKQETESAGPRGYLAEYGEYMPPPKQYKKQKEVHVPVLTDRSKSSDKIDDEDGHYIIQENSRLGEKYSLMNLLGQGTFGKVVKAIDLRTRKEVAVKVIRAVPKYRDASRIELRVLQTLRAADEQNRNRCIQLRDCFDWRGHICIVTPLLGLSVFDFLKQGGFVPFPGSHIQAFARQLLGSIAFLHDLNLIHTDLKPENILLLSHLYQTFTYNRNIPSSSTLNARSAKFRRVLLSPQINLIDFGSATFDDEYHSSVVSTRHYRAPEIILGIGILHSHTPSQTSSTDKTLGWSHPIDLWSFGCILVECWTGDALFQTHDCCEHLAMMEAVTGVNIDKSLIREVNRTSKRGDKNSAARFFKSGHLNYPLVDTPRQSKKFVRGMKRLETIIPPTTEFNKLFLDLLRRIFVYDPKKRITAREALKHPWFDELVEDDGTEAGRIRVERERLDQEREGVGRESARPSDRRGWDQ
ncbi:serine threonine protein kinase CMGC group [Friedmanniomyces endolithicus]|uniref:Serine threonine protein kinase CMGC group n=1 Tax=Friedmanniomyces endolithicus TaxID=329885 RepID=A0AAN6H1B8_9PEZI|nr:serine threonine protein kinase CMGC group [Friedmanniomyces endolithicus]KAK0952610.1 serine threonine protein kinase CMGC group [Friedmanniomyces endolithicus]KAK1033104.1 serine threonine protein kinase CMGC group [Friedmanniomyces endolithicus]